MAGLRLRSIPQAKHGFPDNLACKGSRCVLPALSVMMISQGKSCCAVGWGDGCNHLVKHVTRRNRENSSLPDFLQYEHRKRIALSNSYKRHLGMGFERFLETRLAKTAVRAERRWDFFHQYLHQHTPSGTSKIKCARGNRTLSEYCMPTFVIPIRKPTINWPYRATQKQCKGIDAIEPPCSFNSWLGVEWCEERLFSQSATEGEPFLKREKGPIDSEEGSASWATRRE